MNHPSETRCWDSSGTVFALGRQGSCPAEMPPAYQGDAWAGEGQGCSLRAARHGAKTTGGNRGTGGKTNGAERLIQTGAAPRGRAAARKKPHGQPQPRVRGTGWRGAARRGTGKGWASCAPCPHGLLSTWLPQCHELTPRCEQEEEMLGRAGRTSQTCVISHSGLCRVCHLLHQLNALKMLLTRGKAICGLPTRAGEGWLSQMGCWWHSRGWRVLSWV